MSPDWDAIVVGSGLGGLTCAAYLATNGIRPLVLEQYDTIGGSTHVFRRQRRWEFDVGVHYLGDCEPDGLIPTVLRGAGLEGRITFRPMDPDGFSTIMLPGLSFRVPRGWDAYRRRLLDTFPAERDGLERCVGVLRRVGEHADQFTVPVGLPAMAGWAARDPRATYWALRPLAQLFDACGISARARAVICGEAGVYAAPPSRVPVGMHAGVMNHYLRSGAWYPAGGGQVISAHLADVIRTHGGDVRTRHKVARIETDRRRVRGVRLADGELITAPLVVSNADVKRTYLELVEPGRLPRRTTWRARRYRMALPLFSVYLGLDIKLSQLMGNTNIWYHPSTDHEALFRAAYRGEIGADLLADPPVYLTSASLKDPGNPQLAPPGHSCLQVMTAVPAQYDFWGLPGGPATGQRYRRVPGYRDTKAAITDALVAKACELLPGIAGHIVWREGASPLTQERYTLSSDGACYGLEFAVDQFGPLRPAPRTPIAGLYLTGGSTRWCHGIVGSMSGGVGTASAILGRDLHAEIRAGAVFGDPSRLTAGGPGWDPLAACHNLSPRRPVLIGHRRHRPAGQPLARATSRDATPLK